MADETLYRQLILSPGYDTKTGVFGLVCSADNGQTFKVYWTPYGRVWYPEDAKSFLPQLWPLIQQKLKDAGVIEGNINISWDQVQNKPELITEEQLNDKLKGYMPADGSIAWDHIAGKPDLATLDDLKKIELTPGPPGKDGKSGSDGVDGKPGKDGLTPHIDATTGHWFIGNTDTGVSAQGPQGLPGSPGRDGKDGQTPDVTKFATIAGLDEVRTTAESASSAAYSAQSAAQEAQSTASGAANTANSAYSLASNANQTANSALNRINKIDTSNLYTSKEPSAYPDGSISYEVKSVAYLGINRSGIASELQNGSTAIVTTKSYNGMVRQTAEIIDSQVPATFIRNGYQSTWSSWYISQLTAM